MKEKILNTTDEAILVKCCKDNNPFAQQVLYNKYVEQMMILCLRYVVNSEDAREVLMDSFYSFYKNIQSFTYHGEGSVKAWLRKIVVNHCLMRLRKRRTFFISVKEAGNDDMADDTATALDYLNAREIMSMIQALPDGYRTVFNLYAFEGMTHKEIGELLNISESTSKSQLHRARAILKEKLVQAS